MSTTQTDELITAQQYADEMGVTLRNVYQMRYLGTGPVSHIRSGRIVFRRSDIDAYLERQRVRTLRGEGVLNEAHANAGD
jgi:plasmid stabilization system protein ParE